MKKKRRYTELPDLELSAELHEKVRTMTELADRDIAELRTKKATASELASRPGGDEATQSPRPQHP